MTQINKLYDKYEKLTAKQRRVFAQNGNPRARYAKGNILRNKRKTLEMSIKGEMNKND